MNNEHMNKCFRILEESISDVGYWSWWNSDFPNLFQLEFSGVQLWNSPLQKEQPPSSTIALKFLKPVSVSFLTKNLPGELRDNWFELLHKDKVEPFAIDHNCFAINDKIKVQDLLQDKKDVKTIYGVQLEKRGLFDLNFFVCFWAGPVGVVVFADGMRIFNHFGEIEISKIPLMRRKWWNYWKVYWRKKGTNDELPKDYTCEVTIPAQDD